MSKTLNVWRMKNTFTLAEAALLMIGMSPDSWPNSKLLGETPKGFKVIFKKMTEDAKCEKGYVESELAEYEGQFYMGYALMTYNPNELDKRTESEWLSTEADKSSLHHWAKSLRAWLIANKLDISGLDFNFFDYELQPATAEDINKPLKDSEKTSLLKIIVALAANGYKYPNRGAQAEILRDFELNHNGVAENTLSDYLNEAKQYLLAIPEKP